MSRSQLQSTGSWLPPAPRSAGCANQLATDVGSGRATQHLYGGHLFVFVSRRRSHLKILTWDGSGLVILYKRLSRGRFVLPDTDPSGDARTTTLDPAALATLLDGVAVVGRRGSRSASRASPRIDTASTL